MYNFFKRYFINVKNMVVIGCNYIFLKPIIITKWEKECEKPNNLLYNTIEIFKLKDMYLIV
jgi:hypothetical protein